MRAKIWGVVTLLVAFAFLSLAGCSVSTNSEDLGSTSQAACTGTTLALTPTGSQDPGTVVTLTASGATCAGGETPEYRFAYAREGSGGYSEIQPYGASNTATWDTTGLHSGKYSVIVYTRAAGSGANFQKITYGSYLLNSVCTGATLVPSPAPPQSVGTQVTLSAGSTCTSGGTAEYRFFYKLSTASSFTEIRTWGAGTANWDTTGLPSGTYNLLVYARASGNTSTWESYRYGNYHLGGGCGSVTLSESPTSPQPSGTSVTLTGAATCDAGLTPDYRFYYQAPGNSTWVLLQDWSTTATASWNSTGLPSGTYTLRVDARGNSTGVESQAFQQYQLASLGYAQIAVGMGFHTCATVNDGTARCWGSNSNGQLGDGTATNRWSPVAVSGLSGVSTVAVGGYHSCALMTDHTVRCWGDNSYGQLGTGNTTASKTPVAVSGVSDATAISCGTYFTCVIRTGGAVSCWGDNSFGQIGNGSFSGSVLTPTAATGVSNATYVAAGGWHTCALISGGTVMCWGENDKGEIGVGTNTAREATPVAVSGLSGVTTLSAGDSHTCVSRSAGDAKCWGLNTYGQLGNNSTTDSNVPIAVSGMSTALSVSAGYAHTCARRTNGSVQCWGDNSYGELGVLTSAPKLTPVTVQNISTAVSALASGGAYSCALLSDGTGRCWGYNGYGQLGDGTAGNNSTPQTVLSP